jgi:hypothetical protein
MPEVAAAIRRLGQALPRMIKAVPLLLALGWAAPNARALPLTVTATINNISPGVLIDFTLKDQVNVTPSRLTTVAGVSNWTTVSSNAGFADHFTTFCIEPNQYFDLGHFYTYDVVDLQGAPNPGIGTGGPGNDGPMGPSKADQIRQLWGMHYAQVNDAVTAAAFQLTIWEIIYGQWFTPYAHQSPINPQAAVDGASAISLAQTWLNSVQIIDPSQFQSDLVGMSNSDQQDAVTLLTPAPPSLALAAIGGLGLLGYVGRRRRAGI